MRFLGIDFGERRIGLAISDEEARVSTPLTTITRVSDSQAIEEILTVVDREGIEQLVLGEPRRLDGSRGAAAERVGSFRRKLAESTGMTVLMVDEALTSHEAAARMRAMGGSSRRHLDAVAAQIILQEALDELSRSSPEDSTAGAPGSEE